MICSFYFEIFYQLEKGQPAWTNCALRRPAPLNTASSTKAFKMRKALSGTTQEEMCMIREHKFMLIQTWAFPPICSVPHNLGVCLPWILLSSGPSFCLFLPTAFSWPGFLLCSDSGPSFAVFFSWPGCLLPSDSVSSRPSFFLFFFFFFSLTLSDCFFYELGVCFPSTEFLQDLVFMSVIMDCFFMHLVVASL